MEATDAFTWDLYFSDPGDERRTQQHQWGGVSLLVLASPQLLSTSGHASMHGIAGHRSQQPWKHKWENIIPERGRDLGSGTYCELVAEPGRGGMSFGLHPCPSPRRVSFSPVHSEKLPVASAQATSKTPAPPEQAKGRGLSPTAVGRLQEGTTLISSERREALSNRQVLCKPALSLGITLLCKMGLMLSSSLLEVL